MPFSYLLALHPKRLAALHKRDGPGARCGGFISAKTISSIGKIVSKWGPVLAAAVVPPLATFAIEKGLSYVSQPPSLPPASIHGETHRPFVDYGYEDLESPEVHALMGDEHRRMITDREAAMYGDVEPIPPPPFGRRGDESVPHVGRGVLSPIY
jgi:hypothetical protein